MPLDGIAVRNIVHEISESALGGRIEKVYQPDKDEVVLLVRGNGRNFKILITSNANFPRIHFTNEKNENPKSPPMFCMMLRKHLSGGRIVGIYQPQLERIVEIKIESLSELGDMTTKTLILEIMGKHSNIILTNESGTIIDCAKRIGFALSSVREVLPGREYSYPPSQDKLNPLEISGGQLASLARGNKNMKIADVIYKSYCGISPQSASEICSRAGVNAHDFAETLSETQLSELDSEWVLVMSDIQNNRYCPEIIYDDTKILDFSSIEYTQFRQFKKVKYDSISVLLEDFYGEKADFHRLKQKTLDLRKLVQTNIERCVKKRDILDKTVNDAKGLDEWRICGELLTSYLSSVTSGAKYYDAENYYDNNEIKRIKLDPELSPSQNAARYFEKYNKAKRQIKAVTEQLKQNDEEIEYLNSINSIIFTDINENEIQEIKEELYEQGYLKKNPVRKGVKEKKSKPLHFVTSEGFHVFVGKNNRQNDELTLKTASPRDIWFHTKEIPGSHVILFLEGKSPTDKALSEAACLAAYFSKAKDSSNVPVDYTEKRNVKKPSGAKPGMVIYEKNRTAYVTPEQSIVDRLTKL